jgi:hypothetical protein
MDRLYLFPADTPVAAARRQWFRASGFELLPWPGNNAATADLAGVLLASPVRCRNDQFVCPDAAWQRFLAQNAPASKLLHIGLRADGPEPNYLNWLRVPKNFRVFFDSALPAKQAPLPPQYFTTLDALWKKLWDGHDKSGFLYYFSWAKLPVQIALEGLATQPDSIEEQRAYLQAAGLAQYLAGCKQRWAHFAPYWEASPCEAEMAAAGQAIAQFELGLSPADVELQSELESLYHHLDTTEQRLKAIAPYFQP